jgi:SPP1 family predicted phage head-tail adaptor
VRAGLLRYRIEIQADVATVETDADEYGDVPERWETEATVWGRVEQTGGRESWQADQVQPDVTALVTIRYYSGVTPKHRLKIGDRILQVRSAIDPDGRRRELRVGCTEEV